MAISVITVLFLSMPLVAQVVDNAPADDPVSNQNKATASLYGNEVDDYLNVNNYTAISPAVRRFGFMHGVPAGDGTDLSNGNEVFNRNAFRGDLGFATRIGGLYVGMRYYGNIYEEVAGSETVTLTPDYDENYQTLKSLTKETHYDPKWRNSTNQLDVLVGIAGHGIKVGFFESMSIDAAKGSDGDFTKTDFKNGVVQYENEPVNYTNFGGHLRPSLQWGTNFSISGMTLSPRAGAAFDIFQHKLVDNTVSYLTYHGVRDSARITKVGDGYNNGYMQPSFSAGADLNIIKDTVSTIISLDYSMDFRLYNNDHGDSGISGTAAGPVSWTNAEKRIDTAIAGKWENYESTLTFNDTSYFNHQIVPRISLDKEVVIDEFYVGLAALVPVTITAESVDRYQIEKTRTVTTLNNPANSAEAKTTTETKNRGNTVDNPGLTETTSIIVAPSVMVGAKYALIHDRLTVNAGIQFEPCTWEYAKTTVSKNNDGTRKTSTTKNGDGVVTEKVDTTEFEPFTESASVTTSWAPFTGAVVGGFILNFNGNAMLDLFATTGAIVNGTSFTVDATTFNVMFIFKF